MLHNGQLIVDRFAVHKVVAEPFRLPHNTVSVELVNQMTGEQSTRNLRWDQHVTTEEPFEFNVGETAKIRVELALLADEDDRPVYKYKIIDTKDGLVVNVKDYGVAGDQVTDDAAAFQAAINAAAPIDQEGTDLHLGPRLPPDNTRAAKTLLSDLLRAGEAFETELEGGIDSENLDRFDQRVNEWAYQHAEDIEMAQVELIRGLER
jgi:hypothetical protein